jgi:hypothetical protein
MSSLNEGDYLFGYSNNRLLELEKMTLFNEHKERERAKMFFSIRHLSAAHVPFFIIAGKGILFDPYIRVVRRT